MKKVVARFSFEENGRRVARERGMEYEFNPTLHTWDVYTHEPDLVPVESPKMQAQNFHDEKVEYIVYGESPNSYVEDGVTKRAWSTTGSWDNSEAAQRACDEMNRMPEDRLDYPWVYRVVKRVTVHSVKFFEVYEGV